MRKRFYRIIAVSLIFSFVFSSASQVLADDVSTAQQTATPAQSAPDAAAPVAPATPTTDTVPAAAAAKAQAQPAIAQAPFDAVPKVLPATQNFKADETTGGLIYTIPIDIPKGRNNLQPDLRLTYNSQDTSKVNPWGYGWSISIPSITRINKSGTDNLYTNNAFTASLSGDLVIVSTTTQGTLYRSRIENGDFLSYLFTNNTWIVTDKTGLKYSFGLATSSREDDIADQSHVYRWMLQEIRDTNDNYISFSYFKDSGVIYPAHISYTGSGTNDGIYSIDFDRESRLDQNISYETGFLTKVQYRMHSITVNVNGVWVKKYALTYTIGDNTSRSLLTAVTESTQANGLIASLPSTTLSYQNNIATVNWNSSTTVPFPITAIADSYVTDINGDGFADILQSVNHSDTNTQEINTYINNKHGGWISTPAYNAPVTLFDDQGITPINNANALLDVNGDDLPDIVTGSLFTANHTFTSATYLNTGFGWSQTTDYQLPVILGEPGVYDDHLIRFADVNGDGLIDIISGGYVSPTGFHNPQGVFINTGKG